MNHRRILSVAALAALSAAVPACRSHRHETATQVVASASDSAAVRVIERDSALRVALAALDSPTIVVEYVDGHRRRVTATARSAHIAVRSERVAEAAADSTAVAHAATQTATATSVRTGGGTSRRWRWMIVAAATVAALCGLIGRWRQNS